MLLHMSYFKFGFICHSLLLSHAACLALTYAQAQRVLGLSAHTRSGWVIIVLSATHLVCFTHR